VDAAATKQRIREAVWSRLDADGISTFPRPVAGRIPNVRNADAAAEQLAQTPEWQAARIVKVNPDAPQRGVRFRALRQGKMLLMPSPRLREGFVLLDPKPSSRADTLRRRASRARSSSARWSTWMRCPRSTCSCSARSP
jgi:5-formyltetrahydrofolate cyclo-ligase